MLPESSRKSTATGRMEKTERVETTMKRTKAATKLKRPCRKIISPEAGSLYDILHDHASIALYAPPISWTDLHTQVLGCRFIQHLPTDNTPSLSTPYSPLGSQHSQMEQDVHKLLNDLTNPYSTLLNRNSSIRNAFKKLFPYQLSETYSDLSIRFGDKHYRTGVRCQAVWKPYKRLHSFNSATTCSSSSSEGSDNSMCIRAPFDTPVLAYLDRRNLHRIRTNCYRVLPRPDGTFNFVIYRLHQMRSEKLLPENPNEDQYILAIMLAMAQQHVYGSLMTGAGFAPKDVQVGVLTVGDDDKSFMAYKCVVPAAFLSMFHEPSKAPRGNAEVTIEYQHVPMWPVHNLKARLVHALGEEIIRKVDPEAMQSFMTESLSSSQEVDFETSSSTVREQVAAIFQNFGKGESPYLRCQ